MTARLVPYRTFTIVDLTVTVQGHSSPCGQSGPPQQVQINIHCSLRHAGFGQSVTSEADLSIGNQGQSGPSPPRIVLCFPSIWIYSERPRAPFNSRMRQVPFLQEKVQSDLSRMRFAEVLQLRARVQWFTDYVNCHLSESRHVADFGDVETGSDLVSLLGSRRLNINPMNTAAQQSQAQHHDALDAITSSNITQSQVEGGSHPSQTGSGNTDLGPPGLSVQLDGIGNTTPVNAENAVLNDNQLPYQNSTVTHDQKTNVFGVSHGLPTDAAARRFVDAYFRNVNGAYPFVNQTKILENLETLGDLARRLRDSESTLLYLVMSIGCTALERASQVPRDTAKRFEVAYAEIIQESVCRDSIESVQILMLLALYSLFDPTGASAYSIVGIAARQAITTGLARKAVGENAYPPAETELCHRLYWSIFALDRLMAVSQGLPVALSDNADVPFPNLTVEEFAGTDRIMHARKLQTSRHVIQLRQLEGRIMDRVHLRRETEVAELTPLDRRATLNGLRASIEDWYIQGCLMSPIGGDNTTLSGSCITARSAAICAAPTAGDVRALPTATAASELQYSLQIDAVCRSANWTAQSAFPFLARDEVVIALSVLEAFPEEWILAHRAARVVRQFEGVISGGMAAFFQMTVCSL
ncbi:hypothetical protein TrVFT333_010327 [Trichoderma virens FT-333]|nr:hypothetical protein TrVFT333_010327 [Trichoderma virens FT-333]